VLFVLTPPLHLPTLFNRLPLGPFVRLVHSLYTRYPPLLFTISLILLFLFTFLSLSFFSYSCFRKRKRKRRRRRRKGDDIEKEASRPSPLLPSSLGPCTAGLGGWNNPRSKGLTLTRFFFLFLSQYSFLIFQSRPAKDILFCLVFKSFR
jgi:hypothetical protein